MNSVPQGSETLPTPFDRLTELACAALELPFGLLSVLEGDQAVFRSEIGTGQRALPREVSVSARLAAMGPDATLVVTDALEDPELCRHPWVTGAPRIRFFAGATICDAAGTPVGALEIQRNVTDEAVVQVKYQEMLETEARERERLANQVRMRTKELLETNQLLLKTQKELLAYKKGLTV